MSLTDAGCPSGLAPGDSAAERIDPSPFVRTSDRRHSLELAVTGARCAGCIAKIEGALGKLDGVDTARLNLSTGKLTVTWTGGLSPAAIIDRLTALGYGAVPFDPQQTLDDETRRSRYLLRCMAVAGFATANIMLLSVGVWSAQGADMGEATRALLHLISALIAIPAVLFAGRPFFESALGALRKRSANMDVPISLAVFLALGVSLVEAMRGGEHAYFDAAVMLLFFLLIGRWLDETLRRKARSAARDLLALQATTALRLSADGQVTPIAARDVVPGDRLVIRPGVRLPVNAEVVEGRSDIDLSLLNGESLPQVATTGTQLFAGTRNLSARIVVRATSDVSHSMVAELARLIESGQQTKDRYTILADRAARAYVPIVHSLAAITLIGWLLLGHGPREAILAATALLIITCPCALGLATPAVQIVATSQLFKRGILVKSGDALERLARASHLVFDKTGTLTTGALAWTNADRLSTAEFEAVTALSRAGFHPIARAIAEAGGPGPLADDVVEVAGEGLAGTWQGQSVRLGRPGFVGADPSEGETVSSWFRLDDRAPVRLDFRDAIRPDGADAIAELKREGLSVHILSGDNEPAVRKVAAALAIEDARGSLRPDDKARIIAELKQSGPVAMVGDGLNDAPALAHADVSLAPGSAVDATQNVADFVYQSNGIQAVDDAYRMSVRARRHILQNFAFAAAYNAVAAPLAMAGFVTPLVAALAMSGSSLVVTLNAMRLSWSERRPVR
jgi:Cu2+-exporting ATPase